MDLQIIVEKKNEFSSVIKKKNNNQYLFTEK